MAFCLYFFFLQLHDLTRRNYSASVSHKCILTDHINWPRKKIHTLLCDGCALIVSVISDDHRVGYVYHIREKVPASFRHLSIHPVNQRFGQDNCYASKG